ncbi:trypsin I-P1 isoform X1 [Bactrocera neohumeralis]|uniref:trypsin I-P1 isoform X1 n=2 Tax=Bactrocera neohumeralis TaxID=98809 RepID=UPI002165F822|nr:trypsin I-P1 isoform X1 [Bactrocera neohumeralis]
MRLLNINSVAFLLLSFVEYNCATPIVGGKVIYNPGNAAPKYPYMVSIQELHKPINSRGVEEFRHFCGGAMLNRWWFVTAAHCFLRKKLARISAVIGHENLSSANQNNSRYAIERVKFIYYQPTNIQNDIALARLKKSYEPELNLIKHAFGILPLPDMKNLSGVSCQIIGYGATQYAGELQNNLIEGEVKIITKQECSNILGRILAPPHDETTLCALGDNQDTCQGDSGGPLICKVNDVPYICGIVSHGLTCGVTGVPSIYTAIVPYLEWITWIINDKVEDS